MRISDWSSDVCSSDLFGMHTNVSGLYALYERSASLSDWWQWFTANAGPALLGGLGGLFVISAVSAIVGYVLASLIWDNWIRLRWRRSEDRRVGEECVRPCRSRWSPVHSKKTTI